MKQKIKQLSYWVLFIYLYLLSDTLMRCLPTAFRNLSFASMSSSLLAISFNFAAIHSFENTGILRKTKPRLPCNN